MMLGMVDEIVSQRDRMSATLEALGYRPYESWTNFVLFGGVDDPAATWQGLYDQGVLIRDIGLPGCLRVTAGTEEETTAFLEALASVDSGSMTTARTARRTRATSESTVELELNLDGTGKSHIDTTVPFFDHMLTAFAKHSLTDLTVRASGDTDIDAHHTVEDIAIVLGQAIREALGDKSGISRYGDALVPLDEALAQAVVDICGRPYLVHTGEPAGFEHHLIGGHFTGSLVRHTFEAIAFNAATHRARPRAGGPRPAPHRRGGVQGVRPRVPSGEGPRPAGGGRPEHEGSAVTTVQSPVDAAAERRSSRCWTTARATCTPP